MKIILYIDDRPHVRENFIKLLSFQNGFLKVLTANSLIEAIDILEQLKIDIVITGRQFSVKEIDLLDHQLRQHEQTKLIVMAGRSSPLSKMLKAFEYKVRLEMPVDANLLLHNLFQEFEIDYGGQIQGISLPSFVQMIELECKTCTVKVISGKSIGYLYFNSGELVDAQSGGLAGKEAAIELFSLENTLITVSYGDTGKERIIHETLMSLLLESGRIIDEKPASFQEKRRYRRFACSLPVEFEYNEWAHKGVIQNISLSGVFIQTSDPFNVGADLVVTLYSHNLEQPCRIEGRIVRRDPAGVGVEFLNLSMKQKGVLRTIIDEISD
jgi:CheY-like chemotaxis protein